MHTDPKRLLALSSSLILAILSAGVSRAETLEAAGRTFPYSPP